MTRSRRGRLRVGLAGLLALSLLLAGCGKYGPPVRSKPDDGRDAENGQKRYEEQQTEGSTP